VDECRRPPTPGSDALWSTLCLAMSLAEGSTRVQVAHTLRLKHCGTLHRDGLVALLDALPTLRSSRAITRGRQDRVMWRLWKLGSPASWCVYRIPTRALQARASLPFDAQEWR